MAEHVDMTIDQVLAVDYICEITCGCTSIIAKTGDGKMHHARNLDYPVATQKMKNLLFEAKFHKGKQYLFSAFVFSGFLGVYTSFKPG